MMHLTEQEITEQAMLDQARGENKGPAAVERHLGECPACTAELADLERNLKAMRQMPVPERDEDYGERVWASIEHSLPTYAAPEVQAKRPWSIWLWKGLSYAAACALLISGAFYAGRRFEQKQHPQIAKTAPEPTPAQPRQPVVVVVLDDHLDRSERFLVQLKHADLDSAELTPMREEARSLLAANRTCRQNLAENKDPELATALDHLDRLLTATANTPGGLNADSIAKLRDEMNADGLLFEVRVLRSRIPQHKTVNAAAKGASV